MNDKYTRKKKESRQTNNETKATKIANQPTNLTHDPHPQPRDLTSETDDSQIQTSTHSRSAHDFNVLDQRQLFMAKNKSKIHSARTFRAC